MSYSRPGAKRAQKWRKSGHDDLDDGQPDVGAGLVEDEQFEAFASRSGLAVVDVGGEVVAVEPSGSR